MQKDYLHDIDAAAPITEQASAWWMLLNHGDATPADHHAFGEWVARSPERVEAFLQTARLMRALQSKDLQWPDTPIETLIREAKSAPAEVIGLPMSHQRHASLEYRESSPWTRRIAVAGIVALVAGGVSFRLLRTERYQTDIGEQRSVVLSDGSVVTLNTSSDIEVHMTKDHRTVELLSGEALFEVARDPARPFDVAAGKTTVRAVGTQFNIDRRPSGTTVTVVEGRVAVFTGNDPGATPADKDANLPVAAGEQLTTAPNTIPHAAPANIATATAWTQRKLVFEHRPLGEVADEFNRYNRERIEIQSPQLRSQEITGVFEANNPESFMSFLEKIPDVTVRRSVVDRRVTVTQSDSDAAKP